jgi:NAD(P)-dependent dehydrogenase (short-subunit alcohol dehydrogenase family)
MNVVSMEKAKSVLVTGANSGLGFEAAAQFAEDGYARVVLICRTREKADDAKTRLVARVGNDVFVPIGAEVSDFASVDAAVRELIEVGVPLNAFILNAGVLPKDTVEITRDGYDIGYGASLVGNHRFVTQMLGAGLIATDGRIVVAGSETARGDVSGMRLPDYRGTSNSKYGGNIERTLAAFLSGNEPTPRARMSVYSMSKLMVAWWAAELSQTLPTGTTVNAISPGGTPGTGFARTAGLGIRAMMGVMSVLGPLFGIMHNVRVGARRYFDAVQFGSDINGQFLASAPRKFTGALVRVESEGIRDRDAQQALWRLLDGV